MLSQLAPGLVKRRVPLRQSCSPQLYLSKKQYSAAASKSKESTGSQFDLKQHWSSSFADEASQKQDADASCSNEEAEDREDSRTEFRLPLDSARPHTPVLCREVMDCFWRLDNLARK